ncbi:uncharacterized protein [Anabrus simplex]|uniref:uncharacterized protein n=1 Tax=Anabrus simplex TaxID=316456 RepID=UPI0035A2DE6B
MAGMLFVVCVPTADYEKKLLQNPQEQNGSQIDLERRQTGVPKSHGFNSAAGRGKGNGGNVRGGTVIPADVPMEQILEELLKKLEVEHVVWCRDKNSNYFQVFFPVGAGDPCENCLHCLTELGIGKKLNSVVSVVPCSVFYQGSDSDLALEEENETEKEAKKNWNNFVQSIRSKLTVKQVVEGVRSGGECSFDYLLLILTADMVAAVGLVENSAVNIVAAMLISPLMSPIMTFTFGTVIADRKLQKIGIRSELIGLFMSLIFGFIFGLFVGTTQSPWGYGDWPTSEMKSRGDTRSLWIGILWALPSGTGVALALLQGSAGPLIGVAISASLLPPSVNCGMMWGLACIMLMYDDVRIPHITGEMYNSTSAYEPKYSYWMPSELSIMGIVSFCLTLINICCIIITAVIVLKIKEVAAPYTSSPDLRRFWEHDIRMARDTNRSIYQSQRRGASTRRNPDKEMMQNVANIPPEDLSSTLEAAVREAMDDVTFRKVKRVSYNRASADLAHVVGLGSSTSAAANSAVNEVSPLNDLATLDQLIQALLGHQKIQQQQQQTSSRLSRVHPLSRSLRLGSTHSTGGRGSARNSWLPQHGSHNLHGQGQNHSPMASNAGLPTILESNSLTRNSDNTRTMSLSERALNAPIVRSLLNTISNTPQRFAVSPTEDPLRNSRYRRNSETISLTQNEEP